MVADIHYSMMTCAQSNQVELFAYVQDLLLQLSAGQPDDLSALLPDEWLKTHPVARRSWLR